MSTITAALAQSTTDMAWLCTIPHTIDQVVGIWAEATSGQARPMRHGLSNTEIVASITARTEGRGGKGSHSDPTPAAALRGEPDARDGDETLAQLDATIDLVEAGATRLGHRIDDALGLDRWHPVTRSNRTSRITTAEARIHRATPKLPLYLPGLDRSDLAEVEHIVRDHIAEPASWLRAKAEGWWRDHHGERLPVAEQRKVTPCTTCSAWRTGTVGGPSGQCQQCRVFRGNHGCDPTEAIVRRWEYAKGATPAQILEAKASSTKRQRRSA